MFPVFSPRLSSHGKDGKTVCHSTIVIEQCSLTTDEFSNQRLCFFNEFLGFSSRQITAATVSISLFHNRGKCFDRFFVDRCHCKMIKVRNSIQFITPIFVKLSGNSSFSGLEKSSLIASMIGQSLLSILLTVLVIGISTPYLSASVITA